MPVSCNPILNIAQTVDCLQLLIEYLKVFDDKSEIIYGKAK